MDKFIIICPKCRSERCELDAYKTSTQTSINPGGMAIPYIKCWNCEYYREGGRHSE